MLKINDVAPEFTLFDQHGDPTSLSQFLGRVVVLYFYPKDDTETCMKEACSFRDMIEQYQQLGAIILGVSKDSIASHHKFIDKYDLRFDLLADESGRVHELYDVIKPKNLFGRSYLGTERTTFVIDQQGKIAQVFPKVRVNGHSENVLNCVKNLVKDKDE